MVHLLQSQEQCVLYGVELQFAIEIVESLKRSQVKVAAGICVGPADWNLFGITSIHAPSEFPKPLLALPYIVTRFPPGIRKQRVAEAEAAGFRQLICVLDPTAILASTCELHDGCFVNAGAAIGGQTCIGKAVFINRLASIGHHVKLDDYVSIGPGANIASRVAIATGTVVGAGASVAPDVRIGSNSIIASGASVHEDVPCDVLVAGNPAVIKKTNITGYRGFRV